VCRMSPSTRSGGTALTRPRGPLPARVYWTRRLVLLLVVLALVLGVARLLGGGRDGGGSAAAGGAGGGEAARPVAGEQRETRSGSANAADRAATAEKPEKPEREKKPKKKPLPQPDGPCADSDVRVAPVVEEAYLDEPVEITLAVSTEESAACTWEVDPETVFVTISSPERQLWSSQHCPAVVPTEAVVPRRTKPHTVTLRWNGKESDPACSAATEWVLAGTYTVTAIARGSVVPAEAELVLQPPRPPEREPATKKKRDRQT
jgi:hypothetical protein